MSRRSRTKGKVGEREVATVLRTAVTLAGGCAEAIRRGWQARHGRDACDVEGTRFWMEVKRRARFAVLRHLEQASEDTDGRPPVVWLREDGNRRWAVLMWADDWLRDARLRDEGGASECSN